MHTFSESAMQEATKHSRMLNKTISMEFVKVLVMNIRVTYELANIINLSL